MRGVGMSGFTPVSAPGRSLAASLLRRAAGLVLSLAICLPVAAPASGIARDAAAAFDICASPLGRALDPVAALVRRGWLPALSDDDSTRIARHTVLRAMAQNLSLMPATTPSRELAHLVNDNVGPEAGAAYTTLQNTMAPKLFVTLTIDWLRADAQHVQRRCAINAPATPEAVALFDDLAARAGTAPGAISEANATVTTIGDLVLRDGDPRVTAWAWKLDAEAFQADTGAPPEAQLFFEITAIFDPVAHREGRK